MSIYIVIPKASIIWLRNSSDSIGFTLKVTEILTWPTFPIYLMSNFEIPFSLYDKGLMKSFFFGKIVLSYLTLVIIPCSFHSSHSRLVISGSWVRFCGFLNPPSSSLKVIIFRARGKLKTCTLQLVFIIGQLADR